MEVWNPAQGGNKELQILANLFILFIMAHTTGRSHPWFILQMELQKSTAFDYLSVFFTKFQVAYLELACVTHMGIFH